MLSALVVSLKVASVATLVVIVPAASAGWLLARRDFFGKSLVSALLTLPLVLPPTAVGFLLLELFADDGLLGRERLGLDLDVLFTWKAAVIAAAVMSAPLVVRTAKVAFEGVDPRLEAMARTLGMGPLGAIAFVTVPLALRGLVAAAVLGFTRSLGEFGATIMIAGNLPGRTRTLASALYSAEQAGRRGEALALLGVALATGLVAVFATEWLAGRRRA